MPTYDYQCTACGHRFEKFQSITAAPIRKCPKCGKAKVKRLIGTGAGLIFKGSGFYITDYRDSSYKDKAKAETGTSAPAAEGGGNASGSEKKQGGSSAETREPSTKKESSGDAGASTKSETKPSKPPKPTKK